MKTIVATLALLGGLSANAACVPDDGRHSNDLSRSQDYLRGVCGTEDRGHRHSHRGYSCNHRSHRHAGYDYGYDNGNDSAYDFDRARLNGN